MQMFEYKCKHCGADLQLDFDNLQGFCQHCGSAVMIESATLSKLMMEREKTRQIKLQHEHEERMYDKKVEAERKEKRAEGIRKLLHSDTTKLILFPFLILFCLLPVMIFCIVDSISSSFKVYELPYSDGEVMGKKLETVKESFSDAGFTNISIEYTANSYGNAVSEGEVAEVTVDGKDAFKKGDKYKKKLNTKIQIFVYTPDGKFAFPYSEETVIGQSILSVKKKLVEIGFNNVQLSEKKSLGALLGVESSNTVLKMTIDGEEKFQIGDRVPYDAAIVIEYYD